MVRPLPTRHQHLLYAINTAFDNDHSSNSLLSLLESLLVNRLLTLPKILDRREVLDAELAILHTLLRRRSWPSPTIAASGRVASAWEPGVRSVVHRDGGEYAWHPTKGSDSLSWDNNVSTGFFGKWTWKRMEAHREDRGSLHLRIFPAPPRPNDRRRLRYSVERGSMMLSSKKSVVRGKRCLFCLVCSTEKRSCAGSDFPVQKNNSPRQTLATREPRNTRPFHLLYGPLSLLQKHFHHRQFREPPHHATSRKGQRPPLPSLQFGWKITLRPPIGRPEVQKWGFPRWGAAAASSRSAGQKLVSADLSNRRCSGAPPYAWKLAWTAVVGSSMAWGRLACFV
ncbi:hypothetical protein B0T16DRAFT_423549 [Cercophora newfieldiana]|uniref:Uncharacterized protein n=1 Tax=Cercophora newfieldiana TaxID=92897 RepID=A0AA40CJB6_9PEZI|nr:hypothetical protein B0T16DRAFT_423549 [Cercophora newfieldiana]